MTFDRVWCHTGNGHWIGSCYYCFAETEEEAATMIRKYLDDAGLKNEPLNLHWRRADIPGVFHADNGDY